MKYIAFLILLGATTFMVSPIHAGPVEIRMAYEDTALPPFYLGEGTRIPEKPGIAVEMLQLLDEQLPEVRIVFRRVPWKRCQRELGAGQVDAIFPGSFNTSRQKIGVYPTRNAQPDALRGIISLSYYFYVLKNTPVSWNSGRLELKGVIGAPTGYSVVGYLREMGLEVDDHATTTMQNLLKLTINRVQAVAAQDVSADPLIQSEPKFKNVIKLFPPINTKPNFLIFSHPFFREHPQLAEHIWSELQVIQKVHFERLSHRYKRLDLAAGN